MKQAPLVAGYRLRGLRISVRRKHLRDLVTCWRQRQFAVLHAAIRKYQDNDTIVCHDQTKARYLVMAASHIKRHMLHRLVLNWHWRAVLANKQASKMQAPPSLEDKMQAVYIQLGINICSHHFTASDLLRVHCFLHHWQSVAWVSHKRKCYLGRSMSLACYGPAIQERAQTVILQVPVLRWRIATIRHKIRAPKVLSSIKATNRRLEEQAIKARQKMAVDRLQMRSMALAYNDPPKRTAARKALIENLAGGRTTCSVHASYTQVPSLCTFC